MCKYGTLQLLAPVVYYCYYVLFRNMVMQRPFNNAVNLALFFCVITKYRANEHQNSCNRDNRLQ